MPLGARTDLADAAYVGVESYDDVVERAPPNDTVARAVSRAFDFVLVPVTIDDFSKISVAPGAYAASPSMHSDGCLDSATWSARVVMRLSRATQRDVVMDGEEAGARRELAWAAHVGANAVTFSLDARHRAANVRYANIVSGSLGMLTHTKVWARVRVDDEMLEDEDGMRTSASSCETSYAEWAAFMSACEHDANVYALLEVGGGDVVHGTWRRWIGERVGAVVLRVDAFRTNARGFPVLPKETQAFIREMFTRNVQVILSDIDSSSRDFERLRCIAPRDVEGDASRVADADAHPMRLYWEYLVYLFRGIDALTEQALIEIPYRDYLQAPLQPLMDNLESVTYETFEKDASKYNQYEEAVRLALLDGVREGDDAVVMVVGAGRGPLVRASLRAANAARRNIIVYAIEKNPNAVVTLQHLAQSDEWRGKVFVCPGDMRSSNLGDVKADIIVSELLGSFGDNELSPECLDGAMWMLKEGGVSIPAEYESFVAPVTAAKLYTGAKAYKDREHMETPYVVQFHRVHRIAEPKSVWTFSHPNKQMPSNERYVTVDFETTHSATIHGFAGYFDALLYSGKSGTVRCSIHPHNHTLGPTGEPMFSWFPMYFPIREPALARAGERIALHLWRRVDAHKMWYEWLLESPTHGPIHNVNGRSYWIGL